MLTAASPLDRDTCARLLADPETSATTLHLIVLTTYGDAVYGDPDQGLMPIDPVLLWALIREDFGVTVPESNENKLNALITAISTDAFYETEEAFVATCLALYNGDMGDIVNGILEDITAPEALWGMYEVALNRNDDMDFHPSIIARILRELADAPEDTDDPLQYYLRDMVENKMRFLVELEALQIPEDVLLQIVNFNWDPKLSTV